jgi:hypothetical protein
VGSPKVCSPRTVLLLQLRPLSLSDYMYGTMEQAQDASQSAAPSQLLAQKQKLRTTYLHCSKIIVDIYRTRSTDVWRCRETNILRHARQNRDLEVVCCLVPDLVGPLLRKLDHVLSVVATQRSPSSLQLEHPLVAFFENVLAHVSDRLEVLAVHLMPLSRGYDLKILLLIIEKLCLVRDLLGSSLIYTLDHRKIFRMDAVRLLEHFELPFVLRYLLIT